MRGGQMQPQLGIWKRLIKKQCVRRCCQYEAQKMSEKPHFMVWPCILYTLKSVSWWQHAEAICKFLHATILAELSIMWLYLVAYETILPPSTTTHIPAKSQRFFLTASEVCRKSVITLQTLAGHHYWPWKIDYTWKSLGLWPWLFLWQPNFCS